MIFKTITWPTDSRWPIFNFFFFFRGVVTDSLRTSGLEDLGENVLSGHRINNTITNLWIVCVYMQLRYCNFQYIYIYIGRFLGSNFTITCPPIHRRKLTKNHCVRDVAKSNIFRRRLTMSENPHITSSSSSSKLWNTIILSILFLLYPLPLRFYVYFN